MLSGKSSFLTFSLSPFCVSGNVFANCLSFSRDFSRWNGAINFYRSATYNQHLEVMRPKGTWNIRVRTLHIFGTGDTFISVEPAQDSAEWAADYRLELVEGASHWQQTLCSLNDLLHSKPPPRRLTVHHLNKVPLHTAAKTVVRGRVTWAVRLAQFLMSYGLKCQWKHSAIIKYCISITFM